MNLSKKKSNILNIYIQLLLLFIHQIYANENNHKYTENEEIWLWANTIGPYYNRQETYEFTSLPFCLTQRNSIQHRETIGEAILGYDLLNTGLEISFKKNLNNTIICKKHLVHEDIEKFAMAIENKYWYEMFLDDLPIHGLVGEIKNDNEIYLFSHYEILLKYNEDRIIQVDFDSNKRNPILLQTSEDSEMDIDFTYSVQWEETDKSFKDRFDRYLDSSSFEIKIHVVSIINSIVIAFLLIGVVIAILYKTLKSDSKNYDKEGLLDFDTDFGDEYGWKLVHGDIFRRPPHCAVLSAFLGTGVQLIILLFIVIIYTIMRDLYLDQATVLTSTIFIYAITSMIGGYYSGSFFAKCGGRSWIKNMFLVSCLLPCFIGGVTLIINFVALCYSSSRVIPFSTMLSIFSIWLFIIFPLTLFGTIIGRNWAGDPNNPCRVNLIPRPIPEKPLYFQPFVLILASGLLPFASVLIELYYIYSSFWSYKIYYVYGFILVILFILILLTACVSIISTFLLLNAEDHRWPWISFFSGASTVIYVFLFSIYYFFNRTKMHGLLQTVLYFGNTGIICFCLMAILGKLEQQLI